MTRKFNLITILKQNYKIILLTTLLLSFLYLYKIRPILIKKGCYYSATQQAIEKNKQEESAQYLYDRSHWKEYTTSSCNSYGCVFSSKMAIPAFPNNLKTGVEPSYIQENLNRISKENIFTKENYDTYYKWCLHSKGI